MMNLTTEVQRRGGELVNLWRTFWFRQEPAHTLGLVRIAFGGILVFWTLWMWQGLYAGFGTDGVVPNPPARAFVWGVFHEFTSNQALVIGWFVLLGASIALMVGWHSRLAAVVVFILVMSLERRNPGIFNGGDALLRIESVYMMLAPCGAALSLDQRRRTGSFWSAQQIRPWALRLLQIQLSIVYLSTVVAKLSGETWHNGTAVLYSLNLTDLQTFHLPSFISHNLLLSNVMTWGTLVIEVAIGLLVWNRRCRPWVLLGGVVLHLSISLAIEVGFFTFVTFVLYLAFIPAERAKAVAEGVQSRLQKLSARRRHSALVSDDEKLPKYGMQEVVPENVEHKLRDEEIGVLRQDDHDERNGGRRRLPTVTTPQRVPPPAARRRPNGHVPNSDAATFSSTPHTGRLADTEPPHRVGEAGRKPVNDLRGDGRPPRDPAPVPAPHRDSAEPSGRHARRFASAEDPQRGFHWPDDVRSRIDV
jgi:hypothetical protein